MFLRALLQHILTAQKSIGYVYHRMKKQHNSEDLALGKLTINVENHIIKDLSVMEQNTKIPVDELVARALKFFIATHNDYLGKSRFV